MSSIFSKSSNRKGFTLIEMLVVVAIFMITTGIVLSNFKGFNRKSALDLLAQETSLVIRQAQVYGTATKLYEGDNSFPSYGVYFDSQVTANFILFADKNGNNKYQTNELIEQFNLTGGVRIKSIEGCRPGANPECNSIASNKNLNIVFTRPSPGAVFVEDDTKTYSYVRISLQDPSIVEGNDTRAIQVWNTGHIFVESVFD